MLHMERSLMWLDGSKPLPAEFSLLSSLGTPLVKKNLEKYSKGSLANIRCFFK